MEYIAYLRVSTDKQGASGLGLEAQTEALKPYAGQILQTYTEIESGKLDDRPQLAAALAHCRREGCAILIAKIDRLSRDAAFLFTLRKAGVQIVAADMPSAGMLEFGIRAIFAQHEREEIAKRTKAALQAAKARGVRLGCPNPSKGAAVSGARAAAQADTYAQRVAPILRDIMASTQGLQAIAAGLMARSIPTPTGRAVWHKSSVKNLITRLGM